MAVRAFRMDHSRERVEGTDLRKGLVLMTRFDIADLERRAEDAPWVQRLVHFMHAVTDDRVLQVSLAAAVASLWCTLAFGDVRFLVLLPAAVVAARRFKRL